MSEEFRRVLEEDEPQQKGAGIERLRAAWSGGSGSRCSLRAAVVGGDHASSSLPPDLYRSTATVLVERQQVPEAFVRPTVTSELETRLNTISQEILSRSRLEGVCPLRSLPGPARARIQRGGRRAHAQGHPPGAEDHREQGQPAEPTTAFALSYQGRDPRTVALVTNTLASFYIEENLKLRERQAAGTADFLKAQTRPRPEATGRAGGSGSASSGSVTSASCPSRCRRTWPP